MAVTRMEALFGHTLEHCRYLPQPGSSTAYRFSGSGGEIRMSPQTAGRNTLLLGDSGCGKTNTMHQFIAQARQAPAEEPAVHVIFDTKGDFLAHPNFYRQEKDIVLWASQPMPRHIWNIFDEIRADGPDYEERNAAEISNILFQGMENKTQPFFTNAAKLLFQTTLCYFLHRSREDPDRWSRNLNNRYLKQFLNHYTARELMGFFSHYQDLRKVSALIDDETTVSLQSKGVMGELTTMVDKLFVGNFAREAGPGQRYFSVRKAVREKQDQAIFIEYDLSTGESLAPMYSLLVDLALKEALSRQAKGRCCCFLDELKLLPALAHLQDALNFGRSKGVSVVAGLQAVSQIYSVYDEAVAKSIFAGFGNLFCFHLYDPVSREYVRSRSGGNVVSYRHTDPGGRETDRLREGHTVEDWHILDLDLGEAIAFLDSQKTPFRFRFQKDPYL